MIGYSQYKDRAFDGLLRSISNRRIIQTLRKELFKKADFQPEEIPNLNLCNSQIEEDLFFYIDFYANEIIENLEENVGIYKNFFLQSKTLLVENVRDLLLPDEEILFGWEIFYNEYLNKFVQDEHRKKIDKIGYYQKIYEFIMIDMTYNEKYETFIN